MNTPNNKENTSIHLIENENNSNSNSNSTTPKKRANNDLSKTKANGTKTNAPLNAPCNDAITNARILSPPSVTKPKIRSASKKRKVLKSTEFHKNANANSNAKRSKLCTTKTPKQQSITSFVKQTNKFITIKNESSPLLTIRNDFIEKIGNKNMLGQIGKHLKNNFATSYTKKTNRRSIRIDSSITDEDCNTSSLLSSFNRCLVEDYMLLPKGSKVIVLIPISFSKLSKWELFFKQDFQHDHTYLQFGSKQFLHICGDIISSPYVDEISSGMNETKFLHGFGNGHFGSFVNFEYFETQRLITWAEVLYGRDSGLQIWCNASMFSFRDLFTLFSNKRRSNQALLNLLHNFYLEYLGDKISTMEVMLCYYKSLSKQKSEEAVYYQNLVIQLEPPLLDGDNFHNLLSFVDKTFQNGIQRTYTQFCSLGGCIIDTNERDKLISRYKTVMPNHYKMIKLMMGIKSYENLSKNDALKQTHFYDKKLFYAFLSSSRSKNPQLCTWWGIVAAAAAYGNGASRITQNRIGVALGTSCCVQTFLTKTSPYVMNMNKAITSLLKNKTIIVAAMDNNQKGQNRTYQRFGSSNNFVKVTGRFFKDATMCEQNITYKEKPIVSFVCQPIPSSYGMPPFECVDRLNVELLKNPFEFNFISNDTNEIDITGKRVSHYVDFVECDCIVFSLMKYMTGYNSIENKFKYWVNMPNKFKTVLRKKIVKALHSLKSIYLEQFMGLQRKIADYTNPNILHPSKCIIPCVSLRDEIKTDGFGMAVLELLMHAGIIESIDVKTKTSPNEEKIRKEWRLTNNFDTKKLILCLDGLSLERHKSFQKRLIKLPMSFKYAYQQGMVFREALAQVIEVPGPLHQAFHVMQTIFNLYSNLMKWCAKVIKWKKINFSDVSQTFHMSRQLLYIVLEEFERIAWDQFVMEKKDDIESTLTVYGDDNNLAIELAIMFKSYVYDKTINGRTEYVRYMYNFIFIAHKFNLFWQSLRNGDRICQESVMNDFLGVFYLMKKTKYFEIGLQQMEREYRDVTYDELQLIRMNMSFRYQHSDVKNAPLHVLDEVMENINMWSKALPLGTDGKSWQSHTPNLMCARQCINFEREEYSNHRINYEALGNDQKLIPTYRTKGEPRKNIERFRLYEFLINTFDSNNASEIDDKFVENIIDNLKTELSPPKEEVNKEADALENVVSELFHSTSNRTEIDDSEDDGKEINIEEETDMVQNENNVEDNASSTKRTKIHPMSTSNIFEEGKKVLLKMDLVSVRFNIQERNNRFFKKQQDIYKACIDKDNVINNDIAKSNQCNEITVQLKYRERFRLMKRK